MSGVLRAKLVALLKAIGWTIAFGLIGFLPLALGAVLLAVWMQRAAAGAGSAADWSTESGAWRLVLVQSALFLAGFLPATWLIGIKRLELTAKDLRWQPTAPGSRWVGAGLALGAAAAAATMALGVVVGGAEWVRGEGSFAGYLVRVGFSTLILAPAAFSEEVIFRGVPLVLCSRVLGRGTAIVFMAILFGLFHRTNPHVTALGIGNIVLAGVLLGVAFYSPGGIWTAVGVHLGWNATLAALDAPVSGVPTAVSWLEYHSGGPAWLTGGTFGPEGGILATVAITLAVVVATRWTRREAA